MWALVLGKGCSRAVATLVGKTASVPVVIPVTSSSAPSTRSPAREGVREREDKVRVRTNNVASVGII